MKSTDSEENMCSPSDVASQEPDAKRKKRKKYNKPSEETKEIPEEENGFAAQLPTMKW